MAEFTNVEVTDTFDQWRIKTNQLGEDFISFESQVADDIANIDLSDFVTISTAQTISGNKTFSGNSIFTGGVDLNGSIVTSYTAEGITNYSIELGLDKTGDMQSFIDFHATGGSDDYDARVFRSSSGVFEITQRGSGALHLNTSDGANIELYSNSAASSIRNNIYYDANSHIFRNKDGSDNKRVLIDDGTITADSTISAPSVNITGTGSTNKLTVESGKMKLRNQDYTWPSSYSAGRYLRTDSQGNLTWEEVAGGSGSVNLSTLVFNDIVPVGTIMPWAGTALPSDGKWKFCDGAQVSNATYPQLATLLGTKYGSASSGKTMLPNLGGKVPLGAGGAFSVGGTGGSATAPIGGNTGSTKLTAAQSGLPSHSHDINTDATFSTVNDPANDEIDLIVGCRRSAGNTSAEHNGSDVLNTLGKYIANAGGTDATASHSHTLSGSVSTIQPYLTTQYIIKVLPDDVQQVSINAGNGINVKNASNQDTTTLDLFSTKIELKADTSQFKFSSSGLLQLVTPVVSQASITNQINTAVSGLATEAYVDNNVSSTTSFGVNYTKDVDYQNTSDRKILVTVIIDGGNDIYGFAAHVKSTTPVGGGSGRDSSGRDRSTCYAYEYHVSDGSAADATTLIFVVPPKFYFKITGDASVIRAISWEL